MVPLTVPFTLMTMSKRRIGIMGGTFDPIHHGHLVAASEVQHFFNLDEVVFVPTGMPYKKADTRVTPAEDRYLMTVIATASNPRFYVSRVDIDREGPTYTADTSRHRAAVRADGRPVLHHRRGRASQMLSWHAAEEMFTRAHFIGVTRPGHELADPGLPDGRVTLVEVPALAISSTEVRNRVKAESPSGTWFRTGSCSTSPSASSTGLIFRPR